jgi:hypothetical protein
MLKPGIYRLNPRRISVRELQALVPGPRVTPLLLARFLRLWWPRAFLWHPAAMFPISWSEIPPEATALLNPSVAALRAGGFSPVFWFEVREIDIRGYGGAFLSGDRRTVVSAQAGFARAGVRRAVTKATSITRSQHRIITTSERPWLENPPEYGMAHLPGKPAGELLAAHLERIASTELEENEPAGLLERMKEGAERWLSFQVERGVFVWVASGEERLSRSILRP